ncbi:hypothetical protein [Nitrospira sp. M1]
MIKMALISCCALTLIFMSSPSSASSTHDFSVPDIENYLQLIKDLKTPTTKLDEYLKEKSKQIDSVAPGGGGTVKLNVKIDGFTPPSGATVDELKSDIVQLLNQALDPAVPLWEEVTITPAPAGGKPNKFSLTPSDGTLAYKLWKTYTTPGAKAPSNEEKTHLNRLLIEGEKHIVLKTQETDICVSYRKNPDKEGENIGDSILGLDQASAGNITTYSLLRYNLADKKSSFNDQAAGFGLALRWYTEAQLAKANTTKISDVPTACRATTRDIVDYFNPEKGLPKIAPLFSVAPTIFVSQDKDDSMLTVQPALTIGILNDFISMGVGYNLSGPDAGEWFILAGPSIGFSF